MELNETLIDDIKLTGELAKKPTTCFGKMMVMRDIYTVNEKCQFFRKKVNQIYNNFEIWDGVAFTKPVLPKPKRKEKSEKLKKKNFVLENVNKFKIPFFNMFVKSVGVSSINEKSEKRDISGNSLLHFKSNRKNEIKPISNSKQRNQETPLSKFVPIKDRNKSDYKDQKVETFNNISLSAKSNATQRSLKQVSLYSKLQSKKNTSNFFLTDVCETKITKIFGINEHNSKKTNKSDEIVENESVFNNSEGLTKELKDIIKKDKPMNMKFPRQINFHRPKSMGEGKSVWPVIKEEEININQLNNVMKLGYKAKETKKDKWKKKTLNNSNNKRNTIEKGESDDVIILSSNGFVTTGDDVTIKQRLNTISRESNKSLAMKSVNKTPNKFFTLTQTDYVCNSTKNNSEFSLNNIMSHIHQLTDTNSIINQKISQDKRFYDGINCDIREDYTKLEKEQLKDSIPKKSVVGEITTKGQKRYISKSRADLIRLSDSVVKLGPENVLKFYNMLSGKYDDYAKEAEVDEIELEKKRNILKVKNDNLKVNNLKMKSLAENINYIYTRNCKSSSKKLRKSEL